MNYDVFISCKSEDYIYAESIYEYLRQNGIQTFLASKELRVLGDSEYRKAISKALASAYHMIIFASKAEYIDSDWVYYEWDWFITAKLKRKKSGAIITILKDTDVETINPDLWKYESFSYDSYQDKLLNYVETPDSCQRRIELEEQNKKEAEEKRLAIIQAIKDLAKDFYLQEARLQILQNELIDSNKALGKATKECPVCGKAVSLADTWCNRCGLFFNPLYSLDGRDDTLHMNKEYLAHFRTIWKTQKAYLDSRQKPSVDLTPVVSNLKNTIAILEKELENKEIQLKKERMRVEKSIKDAEQSEALRMEIARLRDEMEKDKSKVSRTKKTESVQIKKNDSSSRNRESLMKAIGVLLSRNACDKSRNVFASDPVSVINLVGFRRDFCAKYGVTLSFRDMKNCEKVSDLKKWAVESITK